MGPVSVSINSSEIDITDVIQSAWLFTAANHGNYPQLYKAKDTAKHLCTVKSDNQGVRLMPATHMNITQLSNMLLYNAITNSQ